MITVALFRNVNLGHPGSPTGDELVEAFGGPAVARSFQSNGTVVFEAMDPENASAAAIIRAGHRVSANCCHPGAGANSARGRGCASGRSRGRCLSLDDLVL
ncbi:hypothetical protein [Yimella lutea]|uniref:hypothetical protein n=1 Tax=Yimella lutea TaxID=587872 RepID=UPI001153659D|nr:hypothetical protein [Yimella lutea]